MNGNVSGAVVSETCETNRGMDDGRFAMRCLRLRSGDACNKPRNVHQLSSRLQGPTALSLVTSDRNMHGAVYFGECTVASTMDNEGDHTKYMRFRMEEALLLLSGIRKLMRRTPLAMPVVPGEMPPISQRPISQPCAYY